MNNPTIVSAALSDKELQDSINRMVANFDKGLQTMLEHSNEYVGKIQESLQKIGNTNFGAKGSNDGGVAKQTKAQEEFTESVKRSTNEIKKHGKESEMTFDQITNALSQARRTVSDFNTKRASGILPSSEDYKRYEQALARIVEYNDMLKQSALGVADANQKAFTFDGKRAIQEISAVDDRLKQLNKEYRKQEIQSNKSLRGEFAAALKMPTTNIDEIAAKLMRLQYILQEMRGTEILSPSQIASGNKAIGILLKDLERMLGLQQEINSSTNQQSSAFIENFRNYRDVIRDAAQAMRRELQTSTLGVVRYETSSSVTGRRYSSLIYQENDARAKGLSIEEQILQVIRQRHEAEKAYSATQRNNITQSQQILDNSQPSSSAKKTFAEYEDLRSAIASVLKISTDQVNMARSEKASYNALSDTLAQLTSAYQRLNSESRKSENASVLIASIQETQRAMQEIQRQMSRPVSLRSALDLPEKSIDDVNYKIQMLRSYVQGINSETNAGAAETRRVLDEVERLGEYLKNLQKTTKQVREEANSTKFDKISQMPTDGIKQVGQKIKEVRQYISELKSQPIVDEKNLRRAEALFDRLIKQAQKLNSVQGTKKNVNRALKQQANTLDEISQKMQRLQAIRSHLNIETQKALIDRINAALIELKKQQDGVLQRNQQMIASNTALGRSWNYMKNRLAFYFTVGASTQFVRNLIEVRSQYEMNERALGILIDSAERGTQIFNELSQMALVSPYTLIELSTAAKQLTAYDVAAKDVVDTTRRLADMAAAVGIPIERLTYALGQIKAYGYLNSRDARMFANAGIPLVKQLSEYYTELEGRLVSTADVYDRIKKKSIDYNEVMEVINKMTDQGGKFFDFQAKMADTLKVRLANLTLAWNNMLNEIGKSNQGILTIGIGALKELFLRWKDFSSAIYSAAWAGGLVIAIRALNVLLVKAGFNLRILSKDMTAAGIAGQGLATKMSVLGKSIAALAKSSLTWWSLLAFAIVDAAKDLYYMNEAQENLNKSIRDGAKDNYDNISKFLEQYKEIRESLYATQKVALGSIYNPSTGKPAATAYSEQQVGKDIDKNEAKKAWEAIREQIELTSQSSDVYISKLLTIENMSERVRQGFNILDDIQVVNAALKELDNDTIKVSKDLSAWWNAWQAPDGLITNLKDLEESEKKLLSVESSFQEALTTGKYTILAQDYLRNLERVREDLKVTTDSILNFIELKGWSGDESKINQVFEQITQKIILDNQLDPQKAFTLQTEIEEARSKAAKNALVKRIQDEQAALKVSYNQDIAESLKKDIDEYKHWDDFNGRKKVEWERFTKWLKEQHMSETAQMFRNMDAEDIKSLNFQEGKHAEWVTRMVTQYAKEHKMSIDEVEGYLKNFVRNANRMSIFIPLIISTEDKKSVYDQLGEYDKAIDDADSRIARLTKRIGELNKKKKKSKEETKELVRAEQELADAQKAKADAEAKGGHGKKEAKDEKAARKAAKEAESELAKALKEELSTIDKVRSIYKDLTKEGMSHANAVERATRGWDETVNAINRVLQKNGLQKLDLSKFVGIENPRELVNMLQSQLDILVKRGAKPAEIKEFQAKINTLEVEADKYDLTKITKGLNNELGKLKDEYELAVELDANPELGGIFADMMGLDKEQLAQMPRDFNAVVVRMQKIIDDKLGVGKFNLVENLNKSVFDAWLKANKQGTPEDDAIAKSLESIIDYVNKIRLDSSKKQIEEWNKLLEKYAEYEYKRTQIQKEAEREREVARKKGANQNIIDAINNREKQRYAQLDFEEFQKSSYWITATGDLANLSRSAIDVLIQRLNAAKKSFKNLDAKQIKQLNSALSKLYKEQRKNNPFKAIGDMLQESRERFDDFQREITETEQKIQRIELLKGMGDATEEQIKSLPKLVEKLKKLKEAQEAASEPDATQWVAAIQETIGAVQQAISVFNDLAKAVAGVDSTVIDDVFSVVNKAGQGAAIGAQFGGKGAIIGAVAGAVTGLIEVLSSAGDNKITKQIEKSEQAVKRLELAYIDIQHAMDKAYGANIVGAKRAAAASKELQLAELERQLALEKSRSSKKRDEDRIIELEKEIKELRYEIEETITSIVDDLLGSDVGSFAENLVSSMVDAFKQGEDYMKVFEEKFDDMIDSMIIKSITSRVVASYLDKLWENVEDRINARTKTESDQWAAAQAASDKLKNMTFTEWLRSKGYPDPDKWGDLYRGNELEELAKAFQAEKEAAKAAEKAAKDNLDAAQAVTDDDLAYVMEEIEKFKPELGERLKEILGAYYTFGQSSDKSLSALQQGIQGITEDTAGALEAYMNSVSQQVYYHSSLLEQIRDSVVGLDLDVSLGVQSQMLLQLQNSYQTQQAIQQILEGVLVPSGRAFAVELIS